MRFEKLHRLMIGALVFSPVNVFAAVGDAQCKGSQAAGGTCSDAELTTKINSIIDTIFYVIGTLAVVIMLVGAIRYITSTGDSKRIQIAKDTILYALFGIILAILARAIIAFVITKVG
jgi:hypothetical protein